jgi:hypothetical protein
VDIDALLAGSRTLELSPNTDWKWQMRDNIVLQEIPEVSRLRTTLSGPELTRA